MVGRSHLVIIDRPIWCAVRVPLGQLGGSVVAGDDADVVCVCVQEHYHVSYATSGLILAVFPLVSLLVSPFCTHACRQLGR
jgi:hypothetical protein